MRHNLTSFVFRINIHACPLICHIMDQNNPPRNPD
jgi:hypothetical protein